MAVDEVLLGSARSGRATLRFYQWSPPCLSFGRNQVARGRYDGQQADRRGIDVVRRPTGGRSVFHHRELTYSIAASSETWGTLREAYALINAALASGLSRLGATVHLAERSGRGASPGPSARACFRDPLPGEVVAGGRKLVGSAQWREHGAMLQHGSILLHNDQAVVDELRIGDPAAELVPAIGLADLVDQVPSTEEVVRVLTRAFGESLGVSPRTSDLDDAERAHAEQLRSRYADPAWTWRR